MLVSILVLWENIDNNDREKTESENLKTTRYKLFYFNIFILFTMLLTSMSHAVSLDKRYHATLYEARVKVDDKKSENELVSMAFAQVLIKVSGRSDIGQSTDYSRILQQSKNTISQFKYDYKSISDEPENLSKESKPKRQKWFWVKFDAKSVDALLIENNISVWGNTRPVTLIWLSQEVNGQHLLQSQYEAPENHNMLQETAKQRGITLMFPFLDLEDQNSISANDIWSDYSDTILLASRRYQAQASLTIRLFRKKSGFWYSQWNLLLLGKSQTWTIRDKDQSAVLSAGIEQLADKLAEQFTRHVNKNNAQNSTDNTLFIQVKNVSAYRDFKTLNRYFNSLASVSAVTLAKVEQDYVIYKLSFLADKNTLVQEIKSGDLLNPIERNGIDENLNNNKDYKSVILDDLDKKTMLQKEEKQVPEQASELMAEKSQEPIQAIPVPKVEVLVPDLKYWLVR